MSIIKEAYQWLEKTTPTQGCYRDIKCHNSTEEVNYKVNSFNQLNFNSSNKAKLKISIQTMQMKQCRSKVVKSLKNQMNKSIFKKRIVLKKTNQKKALTIMKYAKKETEKVKVLSFKFKILNLQASISQYLSQMLLMCLRIHPNVVRL